MSVADWLGGVSVGVAAWTPRRTFKRIKPGRCNLIDGKPATVEVDAPILPTFVFAPAAAADRLLVLAGNDDPLRPPFSVFTSRGRIPLVGDRDVSGLRQAEADALAALQVQRDAETRQERRRLRAAAAKTERDRRAALRAEVRHFKPGTRVVIPEASPFGGMSGVVESSDGRHAVVAFGGMMTIEIEAWQIVPNPVQGA